VISMPCVIKPRKPHRPPQARLNTGTQGGGAGTQRPGTAGNDIVTPPHTAPVEKPLFRKAPVRVMDGSGRVAFTVSVSEEAYRWLAGLAKEQFRTLRGMAGVVLEEQYRLSGMTNAAPAGALLGAAVKELPASPSVLGGARQAVDPRNVGETTGLPAHLRNTSDAEMAGWDS
jgi:hypothetical protein